MCIERVNEVLHSLKVAELKNTLPNTPIHIAVIGSGKVSAAKTVLKMIKEDDIPKGCTLDIYCDSSLALYKKLGFYRGVKRTFTWTRKENFYGLCTYFFNCCFRGMHPASSGDPWQMGGVAICVENKLTYLFKEETPGYPLLNFDEFINTLKKGSSAPVVVIPTIVKKETKDFTSMSTTEINGKDKESVTVTSAITLSNVVDTNTNDIAPVVIETVTPAVTETVTPALEVSTTTANN